MTDPISDILGDHRAFAARQHERVLLQGVTFDGRHVDDWVPQCLVTATGPRPLPR